jgi:DNA-binding NarL/FixJ family response regulator
VRLEDWRGKTDFELWPPEIARTFRRNDLDVLATGRTQEMVEEATDLEGNHSFWWNFKFPFQDASGHHYVGGIGIDITDRKRIEKQLKDYQEHLEKLVEERTNELRMKSLNLEEVNTALRVLLEQREQDKNELEDKILFNVKKLILPHLDSLKQRHLDDEQRTYLDVLETNLKNIISPFAKKLTSIHANFTPQEIKVADFIRDGKTVKEIAVAFGVSESAINLHRQHIRNKLGLNNQKVNLRTYLLSLT